MEWCCAKCGLTATADDGSLLLVMGWRMIGDGEMRCVICVKRESERFRTSRRRGGSADLVEGDPRMAKDAQKSL